ncbi:MAG: RNA polymerase sigma factor [Acidobacteria bacterium]|nr:RNA polymerase sigma factor [Acidobacteriota bacterium]
MMGVMAEPVAVSTGSLAPSHDFSVWVTAEQKRIFLLCRSFLQDPEEADSATQDVFLKAYRALQHQSREIEDPGKWLTRIAVNTCLDRLRSRRWQFWRKRPSPQEEGLILTMTATTEPDAEDRMFAVEIQRRLGAALSRLSGRQRAVFTLKHFEDRSLLEIGEILGLDVGTVKAHMARAVVKLRDELQDLYQVRGRRGRMR